MLFFKANFVKQNIYGMPIIFQAYFTVGNTNPKVKRNHVKIVNSIIKKRAGTLPFLAFSHSKTLKH